MKTSLRPVLRYAIITTCSILVATGCVLDRRPIPPGWGQVTPAQYCPGDTLTASYDFQGSDACPAGVDCTPYLPTVTLTSTPMLFPSTSLPPGYTGNFAFPASGDAVTVGFHSSANPVLIPTDRFEGGTRVFIQRTGVSDTTSTARRIVGTQAFELTHTGMCAGASPVYAPGEVAPTPRFSPNLRLVDVCNNSGTVLVITISGAGGTTYSQMVPPGNCLDTSAPGVPAGADASRIVDVRPLAPDPTARCSATGPNTPPATLRTIAHMACR
ncbi:MAG: hypothetical protein ACOY82_05040 [Pseudomonadota bacterium]